MFRVREVSLVGALLLASAAVGQAQAQTGWGVKAPVEASAPEAYTPNPLLTERVDPQLYGTQDYTITVISAAQFASFFCVNLDPVTLSNECTCTGGCTEAFHQYANLDIPAGAVIDFIGVNNRTPADATMGFTLHFRDHLGGHAELVSYSFPAHDGFVTDYAGPLGILIPGNLDRAFILDIERAPVQDVTTWHGYVEIWWRRVVSDPPATATFGDVPTSHPFFQFVEALSKSGVTAGCAGGNFCPDAPLTRGQMAVFLSKALGLHWPN
jgi:hypothetical protein